MDRNRLQTLFGKQKLDRREISLLATFYHHYGVTPGDRQVLLQRVDQVPADLVLAQAALKLLSHRTCCCALDVNPWLFGKR